MSIEDVEWEAQQEREHYRKSEKLKSKSFWQQLINVFKKLLNSNKKA